MSDYFIYAHKDTGYFAKISDRAIDDPNLIQAESMPPSINYKWNGVSWTALSNAEIAEIEQDTEPPAPGENDSVETGTIPTEIIEALTAEKDQQKVIETNEKFYDKTTWQQIPDMKLTSRNLVKSFYKIEIEILAKTSKNNRDFEFGLFINGKQQEDNLLHIDFNRANDDKTLNWSDELELEPSSIIALLWRRVGNNVKCTVARRKLRITQQQATGLSDLLPPEIEPSSWKFLGNGGIDFSHGNANNKDIRYRKSMNLIRDSEGVYFTGEIPFKSWVKFEFLKWSRGEGKTLKLVFRSDDACMVGIGSDEIQENSNSLFFNAELAFYLGKTTLISLIGNTGKVWKGTITQINKPFDSNYHSVEIENDGIPNSAIRMFNLPNGDSDNWDNKNNLLYEGKIGATHSSDSPKLMPFFLAQDGSGFKIIAVQVY